MCILSRRNAMSGSSKILRRVLRLAAVVIGLTALVYPMPAFADPPYFFNYDLDSTHVYSGECSFDVVQHEESTLRGMYHPNSGNPYASNYHYRHHGSFTNAQTGISVLYSGSFSLRGYNQDGALTMVILGLYARINLPGQGMVIADVGNLTLRYPPGGSPPDILREAGQWDVLFPALCSALE
jgi:hypothetical protein